MPYKDKSLDRKWHREYMKQKRNVTPVTPNVTPKQAIKKTVLDADGNPIPEYW